MIYTTLKPKTFRLYLAGILSILSISLNNPAKAQAQQVVVYKSLHPAKTAESAIQNLGLESVELSDNSLAATQRVVSFGENGSQIRFERPETMAEDIELSEQLSAINKDRDDFLTWTSANTAVSVDDLSTLLIKLQTSELLFIGPIKQGEGLYQLFIELPDAGYIEVTSSTLSKAEHQGMPIDWNQAWDQMESYGITSLPSRGGSVGGMDGRVFDTVAANLPNAVMSKIKFYYEGYLRGMHIEYESGASLSYGTMQGTVHTLDITTGEQITRVLACKAQPEGSDDFRVSYLYLETAEDQHIAFGYTVSESACIALKPQVGHKVIGFYGLHDDQINSLGIVTQLTKGENTQTDQVAEQIFSERVGSLSGNPFDTMTANPNANIKALSFYFDGYLRGMSVTYDNYVRLTYGSKIGNVHKIELSYEERITSGIACPVKSDDGETDRIGFLHLITTDRQLAFGNADESSECEPFIPEEEDHFIAGFFGSENGELSSLGVIFEATKKGLPFD